MKFLFAAGLALAAASVHAQPTPYIPASDAEVLERLPGGETALRRLRLALARSPQDALLATRFARAAIAQGRARAEPRYYGYAWSALSPWQTQADAPDEVLLLRATLSQQRHDFAAALRDLDRLLTRRPDYAQALLTRATLLTLHSRFDAALRDCAALQARGSALIYAACAAAPASLSGQAAPAYAALRDALAQAADVPVAERLYALTLAAEIAARLDQPAAAGRHFSAALELSRDADQRDAYLLAAYADFLLWQGRAREVLALLGADAREDALLLRLALASQELGSPAFAGQRAELAARFAAARARGDATHRREQALFALHIEKNSAEALTLALPNWREQQEPADAYLLVQAAATGDATAAAPVRNWQRTHGVEDARLARLIAALPAP